MPVSRFEALSLALRSVGLLGSGEHLVERDAGELTIVEVVEREWERVAVLRNANEELVVFTIGAGESEAMRPNGDVIGSVERGSLWKDHDEVPFQRKALSPEAYPLAAAV